MEAGNLLKLTLGKHRGADTTLQNLLVRQVALKTGPHLAFVWRHATRDITKNHPPAEGLALIEPLIGADFLDAHLFTATQTAQLECQPDGSARLRVKQSAATTAAPATHDRAKGHLIPATAPWLSGLGVTNNRGQPRDGMADKFRQIQKFTELLSHLLVDAGLIPPKPLIPELPGDDSTLVTHHSPLRVIDMASGKGYLTFAVAALLGDRATVQGIEARPELVELCNRVARENALPNLTFTAGQIDSYSIENRNSKIENPPDVLIALHACDTATDHAIHAGLRAGASIIMCSPCCHKQLRPQLLSPHPLQPILQHGIHLGQEAEMITDGLRALWLEACGYATQVFEFISLEHTAKNKMILAVKRPQANPAADAQTLSQIQAIKDFYSIREHCLEQLLRSSGMLVVSCQG